MNSYSYIRSVIRTSVCVAASLAAPVSFGAAADRQQAQAQLLDHAEFLCANCFFGASDYYYCFEADNKVLIGYQKTPVLNWRNESKNYLTSVHHTWAACFDDVGGACETLCAPKHFLPPIRRREALDLEFDASCISLEAAQEGAGDSGEGPGDRSAESSGSLRAISAGAGAWRR